MVNFGYFRHRFDASQDPKLQSLVDEMGIVALGYYYSLLEIYGHHFANLGECEIVKIHRRVIANAWRKRVDSCDKVLTKLQLSGLLVYTKCENTYAIDIPNFSKYYGSYKKNTPSTTSNKRKEKKRKEKKEIPPEKKPPNDTKAIIDYLNKKTGKSYKPNSKVTTKHIAARINEGFVLGDFKKVIDIKTEQWQYDPKMQIYLRPETLFSPKFESYLNENKAETIAALDLKLIELMGGK